MTRGNISDLRELGLRLFSSQHSDPCLGLYCLDFALSETPTHQIPLSEVKAVLDACEMYGRAMRATILEPDFCQSRGVQKLLGFQGITDSEGVLIQNEFRVWESSMISRDPQLKGNTVKLADLADIARQMLIEHLYERLLGAYFTLRPSLKPCLGHAVYHRCDRDDCWSIHFKPGRQEFNLRVQIDLLQILVLRHLHYLWTKNQHPVLARVRR